MVPSHTHVVRRLYAAEGLQDLIIDFCYERPESKESTENVECFHRYVAFTTKCAFCYLGGVLQWVATLSIAPIAR
jgi:hypothetical protein